MTSIKFTDKHLAVIEAALEVYSRMKMGQFENAFKEAFPEKLLDSVDHAQLESAHMLLRRVFFKDVDWIQSSSSASYGITNPEVGDGRNAYEVYQTIRQYRAVKRNDGFFEQMYTSYQDPMEITGEPLPVIENWSKDLEIEFEGKAFNSRLHKLAQKEKWEDVWLQVDEYISQHVGYKDMHYAKGTIVELENKPGYYKLIAHKPYRRTA